MDILKTIPEKVGVTHHVRAINIEISSRMAYVSIEVPGEGHKPTIPVDIMELLAGRTTTQQTTVKAFLKAIIAASLEVSDTDVPDGFEPI